MTTTNFPEKALHGPLGDYVAAVSPLTETDPIYHFGAIVTIASLSLSGSYIELPGARIYPNQFSIAVGTSGTHKSHAMNLAMRFSNKRLSSPIVSAPTSKQGLMEALILKGDTQLLTPEDIARYGTPVEVDDGGLVPRKAAMFSGCNPTLINAKEFSGFLKQANQPGTSNLIETFLELYDREDVMENLSKASPMTLVRPNVVVIGTVTPIALERYLGEAQIDNGFLNRFSLWVGDWAEAGIPHPTFNSPEFAADMDTIMAKIQAAGNRPREYQFSASALTHFEGIYHREIYPAKQGDEGAFNSRTDHRTKQFAMIYAALDGVEKIRIEDVDRGYALAKFLAHGAATLAGQVGKSRRNEILDIVVGKLVSQCEKDTPIKVTQISSTLSKRQRALLKDTFPDTALLAKALQDELRVGGVLITDDQFLFHARGCRHLGGQK